jgi:hypothetical protein
MLDLPPEQAGPIFDGMRYAYSDDGTLSERALRFTIESEKQQLGKTDDVSPASVTDFAPLYAVLAELGLTSAPDAAR